MRNAGLIATLIGMAAGALASDGIPAFPERGEWPCYRGNARLDARATVKGRIAQPHIAWRKFIGVTDLDCVAVPEGAPTIPLTATDPRWGLTAPESEVGGQRIPVESTTAVTYADVLPDAPGFEKFEFDSGFNVPTVNGQWQAVGGRCLFWKDGQWNKLWETDPISMLFIPLPIAGDFDKDGNIEVAILPFRELIILDARTGKIKDRCAFTEGRSYGAFYVDDLNGDGLAEFVVLADFVKHIDVLGYRDGKLQAFWDRTIEMTLEHPKTMVRAHPHPIANVIGDGKKEIVSSVFNETGDGRWHLLVLNGMTGAVLVDLPDEFLQGLADLNGDGVAELLTTNARSLNLPEYGTIRVRSLKDGETKTLWEQPHAAWQIWEPPLPLSANTGATRGREDVLLRDFSGHVFAVVRHAPSEDGRESASLMEWRDAAFREKIKVRGARIRARGLDADGRLLLRTSSPSATGAEPSATAGTIVKLETKPRGYGYGYTTPVVARGPGSSPTILVEAPDEEIVALRAPQPDVEPQVAWRVHGRGQTAQYPCSLGPVVADVTGDGARQVLYATAAPEGHARLVAADLDGKTVWSHDFPDLPGPAPVWNTGGVILWQAGRFADAGRHDVLVTIRRNIMHSEETLLLSGRDAHEIWRRPAQVSGRGVGGIPFAVADFDGDGLDDAASFHPSLFYILKGTTGQDLIAMDATWEPVPAKPVYWGMPVAGDFERNGKPDVFFATARRSMTGLVRPDGKLVWWDAIDHSGVGYPAFGDFFGDGRPRVIAPGYDDGVRCYDAATGKIEWRVAQPDSVNWKESASADLNGDGRDESLFVSGNTLWCVGSSPANDVGAVLWQLALPAQLGPSAIADVDGNGQASILIAGVDGCLYCVR